MQTFSVYYTRESGGFIEWLTEDVTASNSDSAIQKLLATRFVADVLCVFDSNNDCVYNNE